jgi:hypothetical protein
MKHAVRRLAIAVGLLASTGLLAAQPAQASSDTLNVNQQLHANQSLTSTNGQYQLIMQTDGNLVEYGPGGLALWSSQTGGNPGAWAVLQGDGNLCVYSSGGAFLWCSFTQGHSGNYAIVQNDDNFVVYTASHVDLWDTHPDLSYPGNCFTQDTWISPWTSDGNGLEIRLYWSPECNKYWAETNSVNPTFSVTDQFGDIGHDTADRNGADGFTTVVGGSGWGQGCIDDSFIANWLCTPKLTHS